MSYKERTTNRYGLPMQGAVQDRPTNAYPGMRFFDTDAKMPIWWDGDGWVDATGAGPKANANRKAKPQAPKSEPEPQPEPEQVEKPEQPEPAE